MDNIDRIAFFVLLILLFAAISSSSDLMGLLALLFSGLMIFKTIFSNEKIDLSFKPFQKALLIYFLIVSVSLFASSLFKLSLHGYIKTLIYILFFYSSCIFFKKNSSKIPAIILFVAGLMSYESMVAIVQNMGGVVEISGWQDMTNINPEQVVSRAYGTLQPYNPNLLAGYLLCGLSSLVYLVLVNLKQGKKRIALVFLAFLLLNLVAIIDTGCRGAYLGFLFFFPVLFLALIYYAKTQLGGLSNVKKRYKNFSIAGIIGIFFFIITNPALIKRFESIFALRADSSISFRLNVYEAAWRMFLDNPFLGIGVGNQNFREIYGLYMKTGFDALGSYCVPLEIAVESGIFALVAFVIFLFFVLKHCLNVCLDNEKLVNTKVLSLCIILMIAATMGHGLFDTIWFRPQLQFLFWMFISMLNSPELN
ncbi:MAG: O-antigen ligase family protein [Candidatus Gastranaerophilales bacterium]|nr:O-antigen ligase family protein [Candidatus Gastranaerophilales bacterium]